MAKKGEVTVKLTVEDGKTIELTQKKLDALNRAMGKVTTGNKKLKTSSNETKRGLEGVGERSNNTSKDFARMSQGMGGLVQVYATVAANVFALSTAFNILSTATNFQDMIKSSRNLSAEFGTSFLLTAKTIQEATKAQIDFKVAVKSANKASAAGIQPGKVAAFAAAAAKSAQTFGGKTADALNRMVTAILQGETELLKEVGIVISSKEAFLQYGIQINKSANNLTSFEKRQALANAVLKESTRLFAGTEIQQNNYEVLAANLFEASQAVLEFFNTTAGLHNIVGKLADSFLLMASAVGLFALSMLKKLRPSLADVIKQAKVTAKSAQKVAKASAEKSLQVQKSLDLGRKQLQAKLNESLLKTAREAAKKRIQTLKDEGRLKAAAFKKGSTLQKLAAGEAITSRGASATLRGKSTQKRRKKGDTPGLGKRDREGIESAINDVVAAQKAEIASKKALTRANKNLVASSKLLIASYKAQRAAAKAAAAGTKAAILTATQGAGTFEFFGLAIQATRAHLAGLKLAAEKSGVALGLMSKAAVWATATITLVGKAVSKAFSFVFAAVIAFETITYVLSLLGIELFKQSEASKILEESSAKMSDAFKESTITLNGMVTAFERLKGVDPDTIFSRTNISIGNFLQELSSNAITDITTMQDVVKKQQTLNKQLILATAKLKKQQADPRNRTVVGIGRAIRIVEKAPLKAARKEVDRLSGALEGAKVPAQELAENMSKVRIALSDAIFKFEQGVPDFPLFERLKDTKALKGLKLDLSGVTDATGLLALVSKGAGKEGLVAVAEGMQAVGEQRTAAGNAIKELTAALVLFEGAADRVNKQVFKSEVIQNYATVIEQAAKSIASLDFNETGGLKKLSISLGVAQEEVKAFVKAFTAALRGAGAATLDRGVTRSVNLNSIKENKIQQAISDTQRKKVSLIFDENTLRISNTKLALEDLKARKELLTLAIQGNKSRKAQVGTIEQSLALNKALTEAATGDRRKALEGKGRALAAELTSLKTKLALRRLNERELETTNSSIRLTEKVLHQQEEYLNWKKAIAAEDASIRQNLRAQSNLLIQILGEEQKIAKAGGEIEKVNALGLEILDARIERKKEDLLLDHQSLINARLTDSINQDKYDRELRLLKIRATSVGLAQRELIINKKLNEGKVLLQDKSAQLGEERTGLTNQQLFDTIMIEGARKLKEELSKANPLQIALDGAFSAVGNAVDSLVSTIGTGQDDMKGILKALNETMHKAVLEGVSTAIKQELLKMFGGDKLKEIREKAKLISRETTNTLLTNISASTAAMAAALKTGIIDVNKGGSGTLLETLRKGKKGDKDTAVITDITDIASSADPIQQSILAATATGNAATVLGNTLTTQVVTNTASMVALLQTLASNPVGGGGGKNPSGISGLISSIVAGEKEGSTATPVTAPIPMAIGGVVHKATRAIIGEGRNSEAVVPLPNNREIPVKLQGDTGGKTEIVQNFDFSGADAATENRIRTAIEDSRKGAFGDVFSAINRGGKFAKISGRR